MLKEELRPDEGRRPRGNNLARIARIARQMLCMAAVVWAGPSGEPTVTRPDQGRPEQKPARARCAREANGRLPYRTVLYVTFVRHSNPLVSRAKGDLVPCTRYLLQPCRNYLIVLRYTAVRDIGQLILNPLFSINDSSSSPRKDVESKETSSRSKPNRIDSTGQRCGAALRPAWVPAIQLPVPVK